MFDKALTIAEALCPSYSFLFLFDHATSHPFYKKDVFCKENMNEKIREKQARLDGKWYYKGTLRKVQLINFKDTNSSRTQKKVQRVLKKQKLWPAKELNLEYLKPKCFNCQFAADSKIFVKSHRRDFCKASRQQSSLICSKTR